MQVGIPFSACICCKHFPFFLRRKMNNLLCCTVSGVPVLTSVIASEDGVSVFFLPTFPMPGSPAIMEYTVTSNPDGIVATGSSTPVVVRGLTPGVEYTFTVTASSAAGTSEPSVPSQVVVATNGIPTCSLVQAEVLHVYL